ncbi:MAG: bifunctional methylenetetrahydrofolate dehydrogenase/methenyltetrahydrofolate cyclohydrolase FolD [Bacilli bacterium]|nr:bifunctional methylenetetrahydrofolate dehydrogenase/methenyltetrahydrofolate cyclohydrolase FolD [Bacilli bacterium]
MILDGKGTSEKLTEKLKIEIEKLPKKITLAIILVGDNEASKTYVKNKHKKCAELGINSKEFYFPANEPQKSILKVIKNLNEDVKVNGILVQLPLPNHLDEDVIINTIDPNKDVDGLTLANQGKLFMNKPGIEPATPKGVMTLLDEYHIDIQGKKVVIVGRSKLVGKPLAILMLKKNATVTIAHSKTVSLKDVTKDADILVAAIGVPKFIKADMVKKDAVVIDVGINRFESKLVGDVDFDEVVEIASAITPVPKGIGPMTIVSLIQNVIECYKIQEEIRLKEQDLGKN